MAKKTKEQLLIQNDAVITTNNNEEITGAVLNQHLKDIIDSVKIDEGATSKGSVLNVGYSYSNITMQGTSTGITISTTPLGAVNVLINGIALEVGINKESYFKSATNIIRGSNNIQFGDTLHLDIDKLGYSIDAAHTISINYLISN